jgi:peptidoglycan-N-acetylglucosamine deacetylase
MSGLSRMLPKRRLRELVMRASSRPPLSRHLRYRGDRTSARVALTFDDGPDATFTPEVLTILARHGARATFFVLGRQVERHPELLRAIRDAGHELGIHGYDHSSRELGRQARRTREILRNQGVDTRLFRPPRGKLAPRAALELTLSGYRTILWSFDSRDSMRSEGKIADKGAGDIDYGALCAGDIVLMHDDNPICVEELGGLLGSLRARALAPVTVGELVDAHT